MNRTIITVDGPSASGKSTVARVVASALGYRHVDSGGLYRALTWHLLQAGLTPGDATAVPAWLDTLPVTLEPVPGGIVFRIAGRVPGPEIRSAEVAAAVSAVAAMPAARAWVNRVLRRTPDLGGVVMDGRDIGSVVFPDAVHQFYLDASPEVRAQRRFAERTGDGAGQGLDSVRAALNRRDAWDAGRREAPLRIPPRARVIDTSAMTPEAVIAAVLRVIREQDSAADAPPATTGKETP